MRKEMVLNELSVREARNPYVAREQIAKLLDTMVAAIQAGAGRTLRTHAPVDSMLLAPDYSLVRWRNDPAVDLERRRFLRSLLTKSPFLSEEDGPEIIGRTTGSDVLFQGQAAIGLRAALLLDALPVSLQSESCWGRSHLSVTCLTLEGGGEILEESADLPHASQVEHIAEHADWLAGRDLPLGGGRDLWRRRAEFFPSLVFCGDVEAQLDALSHGNPLFRQVHKRLLELDRYFRTCGGVFDPSQLAMKVTPESDVTLRKYEDEHSFVCPDGIRRLFSWHGRLTPGVWRIFFLPEPEAGRAVVGYIGRKLPNVSYST
jgi:hypothetical protein